MMKKFVRKVYRVIIPKSLRERVAKMRSPDPLNNLRKEIIRYYSKLPKNQITEEQSEVLNYLKKNSICAYPYAYQRKYAPENIEVFMDNKLGLQYALSDGKRLYFKRNWTKIDYNNILIEQDIDSPHRYLTHEFSLEKNDVVVDVGVAEGIFALDVVEKVRKMYLFESDEEWIEALQATFAPWKEKVEIINKFVSDKNDKENITLDYFFENNNDVNFLKIDVEGAETELLIGCARILSNLKPLKVALCLYHKQSDEKTFTELLKNKGFETSYSKGYMINYFDKELKAPFFRKVLIRAKKGLI